MLCLYYHIYMLPNDSTRGLLYVSLEVIVSIMCNEYTFATVETLCINLFHKLLSSP